MYKKDKLNSLKKTIAYLIFLSLSASLLAQKANKLSIYTFENKTVNNVNSITKDTNNFIWLTTQDGIYRYDSKIFKPFKIGKNENELINSTNVRGLINNKKTNAILGIFINNGIGILNTNTNTNTNTGYFQILDLNKKFGGNNVIQIEAIGENYLIVTKKGVYLYSIKLNQNDKLFNAELLSETENINPSIISKISDTSFAIINLNKELLLFEINKKVLKRVNSKKNNLLQIDIALIYSFTYYANKYYIGTDNGGYIFAKNQDNTIKIESTFLNGAEVYNILNLENGNTYLSASNGFFLLTGLSNLVRQESNSTGIYNDWLSSVFTSFYDGHYIWLGTQKGLALITNLTSPFFKIINTKRDNQTISHAYNLNIRNDKLVISGENGFYNYSKKNGLTKLIDSTTFFLDFIGPKKNEIVSSINKTFVIKNKKLLPIEKIYKEFIGYENLIFNDLEYSDENKIILSTENERGIYLWDCKHKKISTLEKYINISNFITQNNGLFKDGNDIFILTDSILIRYNRLGLKKITIIDKNGKKYGILFDMIKIKNSFYFTSYGTGLIETDSLFVVKKIYNSENGLSNNEVYRILSAGDSLLFVSSNNGINILNLNTKKITILNEEDGLHNDIFEEFSSVKLDSLLFFGGKNGVTEINLKNLTDIKKENNLHFLEIKTVNKYNVSLEKEIVHKDILNIENDIIQTTISFQNVIYPQGSKNNYFYKIKELNNYWINLGNKNEIQLLGISHGTYTLQVKAANEDGIESSPIELTLVFLPKWHQTWWFKVLVALSLIGIGFGLYKMRVAQIIKEQKIKNALASDLHDELGSSLTGLKVYAYQAKKNPEFMTSLEEGITQSIKQVREMIWQLNEEKLTVYDLINKLAIIYKPLLKIGNTELHINIDATVASIELLNKEKSHLYLILKEIINNALKYSQATELNITVQKGKNRLLFTIADNGIGIQDERKGYGLKNIEQRAKEIKYNITRTSSNSGTEYEIAK